MRLDAWLVARAHAPSRLRARVLVEEGLVCVDGRVVRKPSFAVVEGAHVSLLGADHGWVGRGALKLLGALEVLPMDVQAHVCADLGASTGGFTQVLLARGARRVFAVDVGEDQLARELRADGRVSVLDKTNVRDLHGFAEPVTRLTGDLSFISLKQVLPVLATLLASGGQALLLVKPQFEVGRQGLGHGGRVRSEAMRTDAIASVRIDCERCGFRVLGSADSTLAGAKSGNVEHFLWVERV